jgi:epoxyqueuosine reductase QueG
VRVGTIVLRARLDPTPRNYTSHDEYCSFRTRRLCGACIARCPAGALSPSGHNKRACQEFLDRTLKHIGEHYDIGIYGCGLCQTGVPCAAGIPARLETPAG